MNGKYETASRPFELTIVEVALGVKVHIGDRGTASARVLLKGESGPLDAMTVGIVGHASIRAAANSSDQHAGLGGTFLEDCQTRVFVQGAGDELYAQAFRLPSASGREAWRADIFRGPPGSRHGTRNHIGEVTAILGRGNVADAALTKEQEGDGEDSDTSLTLVQQAILGQQDADNPLTLAERRRSQIFEGACEVILKKGYAAASIRDIAKAANLPIPTMYQYIENKEDILFMITSGCMAEIFTSFRDNLSKRGKASSKISKAVANYVAYITKNRRYINLVYRETRWLSAGNREKIFEIEREFTHLWEDMIVQGNESGEFNCSDPALAAAVIYFLCNVWALRHWAVEGWSEAEVTTLLTHFVLSGLVK